MYYLEQKYCFFEVIRELLFIDNIKFIKIL